MILNKKPHNPNRIPHSFRAIRVTMLLLVVCAPKLAFAFDWRVGPAAGIGGAGITTQADVKGSPTQVSRSESPGVFGLVAERQLSDTYIVGIDHYRGFRLGPFSTGVSFTGATFRWYFRDPPPSIPSNEKANAQSALLYKTFVPSVGLASGVGSGTIKREDDQVPSVSGSAVYLGIVFAADYQLSRGSIWRPEIRSYTSIASSATRPTSLKFFTINATFLFLW